MKVSYVLQHGLLVGGGSDIVLGGRRGDNPELLGTPLLRWAVTVHREQRSTPKHKNTHNLSSRTSLKQLTTVMLRKASILSTSHGNTGAKLYMTRTVVRTNTCHTEYRDWAPAACSAVGRGSHRTGSTVLLRLPLSSG